MNINIDNILIFFQYLQNGKEEATVNILIARGLSFNKIVVKIKIRIMF